MTLAAANVADAPVVSARARAPIASPPTWVIGKSAFAPSRKKRMRTQTRAGGRARSGKSKNQPKPAPISATPRRTTTATTPHPDAATAATTLAAPIHRMRATAATTPASQASLARRLRRRQGWTRPAGGRGRRATAAGDRRRMARRGET